MARQKVGTVDWSEEGLTGAGLHSSVWPSRLGLSCLGLCSKDFSSVVLVWVHSFLTLDCVES